VSQAAKFSNPQPDHSVNVSGNDTLEFGRVLVWTLALVITAVVLIFFGARIIVPLTPYAWEERAFGFNLPASDGALSADHARVQALLDELKQLMLLPQGMVLRLSVLEDDVPNAFATVGGRVMVTQGLLDAVESENELAMVLAHELGHLAARDPAVALGATATLGLLGAAFGAGQDGLSQSASALSAMAFSRAQERAADEFALTALKKRYGHSGGADRFFRRIEAERNRASAMVPAFMSTHPSDAGRIARIVASQAGWNPKKQALKSWRGDP